MHFVLMIPDLYEIEEGDKKGIYWQVKFPFPLANRDVSFNSSQSIIQNDLLFQAIYVVIRSLSLTGSKYTFVREMRELNVGGERVWVGLARSEQFSTVPKLKGVVRVEDYIQSLVITSDGNKGTKGYLFSLLLYVHIVARMYSTC